MLPVILLLSACDNLGQLTLNFPAHVESIDGFSTDQEKLVTQRIQELVTEVGAPFVSLPGETPTGSAISISLVPKLSSTSQTGIVEAGGAVDYAMVPEGIGTIQMRSDMTIAGRATRKDHRCEIQIAAFVLDYVDDLLKPVLWHELGHCAGLNHESQTYQIMSAITYPMTYYSQSTVSHFISILTPELH